MAFDDIETPFGKSDKIIGGAATYIAYAASHFTQPIQQVSVVGYDFPTEELDALRQRGVATDAVEIVADRKSFFWAGKYHLDMNTRDTLVTELNVLGDFKPVITEAYQGAAFVMLGNLAPSVQLSVLDQLTTRPQLIALDTMNFWMDVALPELEEVISKIDVLLVNDSEARQLTAEYSLVKAAKKILTMGPQYLIIKKGEHGALLFHKDNVFVAPALPLEEVFDPTGAGDTFAGGFIGYLAKTGDISFENMKTAIIVGSALASFCVEKFGTTRLKEITQEDIHRRVQQFKALTHYQAEV